MIMNKRHIFIFTTIVIIAVIGILVFRYTKTKKDRTKPENILLITIDALRPDHLGCYGYKRNTSPNIDRLAKEGIIFTQAISPAARTAPSLTSIITSAYLTTHRVFLENLILPRSIHTLTEILKSKGYNTGFISGHGSIRSGIEDGFSRGFDISEDFCVKANDISQKAIKWIEKNKDKRFFLWLHYFDPHGPYNPPEPYRTKYLNDGLYRQNKHIPISTSDRQEPIGKGEIPLYVAEKGITDIDYYIAQYDGEISFTDEQLGILLRAIKELGLIKSTLIIITADHGEYLGEHDFYFVHGGLYDAILKVPLILKCEGIIPAGKVIAQQVSLIDIMPTTLSLMKIKVNIKMDGASLLSVIFGRSYNMASTFSEFINPQEVSKKSIRTKQWKLVYDVVNHTYELFDLKEDPQELKNLVDIERDKFKFLKSKLEEWMEKQKSTAVDKARQFDEQTENRLRSLGYVQ